MIEKTIGDSSELQQQASKVALDSVNDTADRHRMSNNALMRALKEAQDKREANEG